MKKWIIAAIGLMTMSLSSFAQSNEGGGFQKENLFTGGDLALGFSSDESIVGANPVLGYSFNNWLDAGISLNFIYTAYRDYDASGTIILDKVHQTTFGPGVFVKVYPASFLYIQAQYENNIITQKYIDSYYGTPTQTISVTAPSYLVGLGYSGGRGGARSLYYYLAVLVDLGNSIYSPYLDHYSDGTTSVEPVIRAGLQIPLFQGRKRF